MLPEMVEELRERIHRVVALAAAMRAILKEGEDAARVAHVRALAAAAEESADESMAMVDRCISHLRR